MANIGEISGRMRMDVREWTQPIKQATAAVSGAVKTATAATSELTQAQRRIVGPTTTAARAMVAQQAAARAAAEAKALLGARARTVTVQLTQMTASVAGATGPLRQLSSLLINLGPGSLAQVGAVVGITAIAGAINLMTAKSREGAKALKEARDALRDLGKTAEDVEQEQFARMAGRIDQLQRKIADNAEIAEGNLIAFFLQERRKNELSKLQAELAVAEAAKAGRELGTPVDRANLAVEFSQASKDTAKSLAMLREAERELTAESSRANVPIKDQVALLGALRKVQAQIAELTPAKIFDGPSMLGTSWEEDLRRRNRLGSEYLEKLRENARETQRIFTEMELPDLSLTLAQARENLDAVLKPIEEQRRRAAELANRIGEDISRGIAYGILQKQQSIADALVSGFRFALADLLAKIIKENLLDPLIKLIADAFKGGGGGGGFTFIPGLPIPVPTGLIPGFLNSPATAAVSAGARSSGAGTSIYLHLPEAAPDPISASRDAQWLRMLAEGNRQLEATGFRFRAA